MVRTKHVTPFLPFPAQAGTHIGHRHRPPPVWSESDIIRCHPLPGAEAGDPIGKIVGLLDLGMVAGALDQFEGALGMRPA
jgi:hypothetical protein